MVPFQVFCEYISLKNHFTKEKYDYHKYCGKSRASVESFYKRRDRFWFEKVSRNKSDEEVVDFFVANFVSCDDPQTLWIGDIIKKGEDRYTSWKKKIQSLTYFFKNESEKIFTSQKVDQLFDCTNGHPIILKKHLSGDISLETMIILNKIFNYKKNFDRKLKDPIWEFISMRIHKYSPFLNIDVFHYKKILKNIVLGEV